MDLHVKSEQLLQAIANSVYDRDPQQIVNFSVKEMHVAEDFLKEFLKDGLKQVGEY
jgi:hypothetical protein